MRNSLQTSNSHFKRSKVAIATSAVLLSSLTATHVFAEEENKAIEVIEVTGIRSSVIAGIDLKRNAESIVDAISSEEMGKFPDANLAEALQRIPEVAIDRDGGEGRYVTIRGLGPEFNQVLLNGRKVATSEPSRAFSFDTIASELVSEMVVYKTQNASLTEGGLGGTIDAKTARPLDNDGLVVAGNLKALYEDNAEEVSPQGSFIISNTFMDGKVGALFGATYQSRDSRTYRVNNSIIFTGGAFFPQTVYQYWTYNVYSNEGENPAYAPIELTRSAVDESRKRLGLNGALQFRPNDQLDITVDYLYSKFEVEKNTYAKSNWLAGVDVPVGVNGHDGVQYGEGGYDGGVIGQSLSELDENGVVTRLSRFNAWGGTSTAYNREDEYRDTETQMFGINVDYMLNDDMRIVVDSAWSKAVDDNKGKNKRRSLETTGIQGLVMNAGVDVPYIEAGAMDVHNAGAEGIEEIMRIRRQYNEGNDIEAENFQLKGDLTITSYDDFTIRTGLIFESSKKSSSEYETPEDVQKLYHKYNNQQYFVPTGMLDVLAPHILALTPSDLGQPSGANNDIYMIDVSAMDSFINDPSNAAIVATDTNARTMEESRQNYAAYLANGSSFDAALTGNSFAVKEEISSFYIEGAYDFIWGGMEGSLIGGLRYSHTNIEATGYSQVITDLVEVTCEVEGRTGCLDPVYASPDLPGSLSKETVKSSYDDFLPSITLNLHLTEDLILRLASSQSLTRPYLDEIAPKFRPGTMTATTRTAKSNNEDLSPYKSTNYDLALEWYFDEGSIASIGAYHKNIADFIVKRTIEDEVVESIATEEYQTFDVVKPWNAEDIKISGISFNLTQTFDLGFGYQFNYTWVDSDSDFDPASFDATKPALPGLGDSYNLVTFYENGPFAARIAYNYRKEFLRTSQFPSDIYAVVFDEPVLVDDYAQVDARVSYQLTEHIKVFIEGVNLTGSTMRQHGRFDNMFVSYQDFGKRYVAGISGKF